MSGQSTPLRVIKTQRNIRVDAVYADKDFQYAAYALKWELQQYLLAKGQIDTAEDLTFFNRQLLSRFADKALIKTYESIIRQFQIEDKELWVFLQLSQYSEKDTAITFVLEANKDYVTINIHPWAKKQDLIDHWPKIEALLATRNGYVKKLRGPKDPKLIYAVMKAREKNIKFAEIADAINGNNLDGYDRKETAKNDWDEWSIRDHYNRYKNIVVK